MRGAVLARRDAFGAAPDRIYAGSQAIVRGQANQVISNGTAIFAAYRAEARRVREQK